jgi:hypothetical protein
MGTDIHGVFQARKDDEWIDVPSDYEQDRDYLLFAWLGNVRNGFGFAGCKTHTPITPLSDCRGLPEDFQMEGEPLEIWMGYHSHSHVLGEEIVNATLPQIIRQGVVSRAVFKAWDGKTVPESYCGGAWGPEIKVDAPDAIDENTTHVAIEWVESTSEALAYFIDEVRRLMDKYGDIRFVFGFYS